MSLSIYYNEQALGHRGYSLLAEKPDRLLELRKLFDELSLPVIATRPASKSALELAHTYNYVSNLEAICRPHAFGQFGDFWAGLKSPYLQYYLRPMAKSFEAATYAVGAVQQAVSDVMKKRNARAFCAVRPPGHHAGPASGEGFCFFNNVAIGAKQAAREGHRVAIIDFDHHHGNGTQAILERSGNDNILFISSFYENDKYAKLQSGHKATKKIVHIPLKAGSTIDEVLNLYEENAMPALYSFKPNLVMLSAGFDMHKEDPLSSIQLESRDYYRITKRLVQAASELCEGRVVSVLEGGYKLKALRESVNFHLAALAS